jgi:hypothetical protein
MNPGSHQTSRHLLDLTLCPAQTLPGRAATLRWQVAGNGVQVTGVLLSTDDENGMTVIESTPASGSRRLIFSRPGLFTFTLAATFSDGARRLRRVSISVGD